jgi:cobalt-zinc-cadmium efflux system outer membrane protein
LRNNLDALVATSTADSARSEARIAHALPNPTVAGVPNSPYQYSATMSLDIGPQRTYRVRASELGVEATAADVLDARRQLTLAVSRAFYDVLLADAVRDIARARHDLVRQLAAADSARVHAGDLPERALMRSQVELLRTEADVARGTLNAQTARITLAGLMGSAVADTGLVLAGDLSYREVPSVNVDQWPGWLARRPDVVASRIRVAQSQAAQHLAGSLVLPAPQLSVVRQYSAPFESGRYTSFGLGFEVPIFNQYAGQRERAAAGVRSAELQRRRVEIQAGREARAARASLIVQRALVKRFESGVIGRTQENVAATQYAYAHGASSLLDVLDAVRAQQDVMTDYYTALHDYWIAVRVEETVLGQLDTGELPAPGRSP